MRLEKWRRVVSFVILATVAASTAGGGSGTQDRLISGELVETYCWAKVRVGGPSHAACGIECAKRGIPIAVFDEASRTLFVLLPGRDKTSIPPALVAAMGKRVSVRGEVIQRAGASFVAVQSWELDKKRPG